MKKAVVVLAALAASIAALTPASAQTNHRHGTSHAQSLTSRVFLDQFAPSTSVYSSRAARPHHWTSSRPSPRRHAGTRPAPAPTPSSAHTRHVAPRILVHPVVPVIAVPTYTPVPTRVIVYPTYTPVPVQVYPTYTPVPVQVYPTYTPVPVAAAPVQSGGVFGAISTASARWGVSYGWLVRVATCESGLNPSAYNPSGASGLFQFMPGTYWLYASRIGETRSYWDAYGAANVAAYMFSIGQSYQWTCR